MYTNLQLLSYISINRYADRAILQADFVLHLLIYII